MRAILARSGPTTAARASVGRPVIPMASRQPRRLGRGMRASAAPRRMAIQAYSGNVDVTFTLQRQVNFGQNVLLAGDVEELGSWDLSRAARMEWTEGRHGEHQWTATVSLPAGANVEYKFVIEDKNHPPLWESCWNRKLTVDQRNTDLYGYWNQPMEEEGTAEHSGSYDANSHSSSPGTNSHINGSVNGKVNGWEGRSRSPAALNGAGLSPEQRAFLERKAAEARGASSAPARRNGAAPAPTGLSAEQQAFLERKRREASLSPSPAPARGRSPAPSRGRSPAAAPRTSSSAAPTRGLSPEQRAFLERKQREASSSPAPSRGRSPARGRSATYTPASPKVAGLSPEQQAFLERKRQQSASPAAQARGRSPAPARGRSPAPARPSSSAPPTTGLSAEQQAFLERKRQASTSPASAPISSVGTTPAAGLSPEQQAFLERKRQQSSSPVPQARARSPAPARGRSPAPARISSSAIPAGLSPEQLAFLERKQRETSGSPSLAAYINGNGASNGRSPVPAGLSAEQVEFMKRAGKL